MVPRRHFVLTKIYGGLLLLGGLTGLKAADEQQLALAQKAQTDFERVEQATAPALPDATRCEQSEAAWLTVAPPTDVASIHFRKGYCELAAAVITHRSDDFRKAADEFEDAMKAWPEHALKAAAKNRPPEPMPASLRLLAPIARLQASFFASDAPHADSALLEQARGEISGAVDHPACSGSLAAAASCESLLKTGRLWLGWMALRQDDLDRAARQFDGLSASGWPQWTAGKQAFHDRQYGEAARQYGEAVEIWNRPQDGASLAARLAPRPDRAQALTDWGGAQVLNGDTAGATTTLDAAVKAAPNPARALFLRGRAEELAGRSEAALADYSLASRTALAHAEDLASGEAHLYRGIMLYRRKDFEHAENEFASALNFDIPQSLRPDAIAWRHMAAVAEGACSAERAPLEQSLAEVSPYFPKSEARAVASTCPLSKPDVSASAI